MSDYKKMTKKQLVETLERRDKVESESCKCTTASEYEGGYGMRTFFVYKHPYCPVHGNPNG